MSEIDWSKAPDCAVAALVATTDNVHYPSVEFVTGYHAYGCMIRATSAVDGRSLSAPSDCWFLVDRPVSPWTGDDLPPVGTVCEFKAGHSQFPELSWTEVRIVSHDSQGGRDFAVFASMSGYGGCCNPADFRPIRTSEQIAAEEREKEDIRALASEIHKHAVYCRLPMSDFGAESLARHLYADGCRVAE